LSADLSVSRSLGHQHDRVTAIASQAWERREENVIDFSQRSQAVIKADASFQHAQQLEFTNGDGRETVSPTVNLVVIQRSIGTSRILLRVMNVIPHEIQDEVH